MRSPYPSSSSLRHTSPPHRRTLPIHTNLPTPTNRHLFPKDTFLSVYCLTRFIYPIVGFPDWVTGVLYADRRADPRVRVRDSLWLERECDRGADRYCRLPLLRTLSPAAI